MQKIALYSRSLSVYMKHVDERTQKPPTYCIFKQKTTILLVFPVS